MYGNTRNKRKGGYKGFAKPSKGNCQKCKKQGHKAMDCCSTAGNSNQNGNGNQNNHDGNSKNQKFCPAYRKDL